MYACVQNPLQALVPLLEAFHYHRVLLLLRLLVVHRLQQLLLVLHEGLDLLLAGAQLIVESGLILGSLLVDAMNLKVNQFLQPLLHLHGVFLVSGRIFEAILPIDWRVAAGVRVLIQEQSRMNGRHAHRCEDQQVLELIDIIL
jgi:hypothetical protein